MTYFQYFGRKLFQHDFQHIIKGRCDALSFSRAPSARARTIDVLKDCCPVATLTQKGQPISGQAKLAIANVDRSFRSLLSKKEIIRQGPRWTSLPSSSSPSSSAQSSALGSRLDHLIAHMCGISVKTLKCVRRAVADNTEEQAARQKLAVFSHLLHGKLIQFFPHLPGEDC